MDSPTLVACTGAISDQFFNADGSPYDPEWTPSMHRYNLVTFSFGGDDIGFPSIVKHCAVGLCPPDQAVRQKISLLDSTGVYKGSELIPPYPTFLRHVATSAVTKGGNVVVMGYPEIFEDPSLVPSVGYCYGFTTGAMATARGWASQRVTGRSAQLGSLHICQSRNRTKLQRNCSVRSVSLRTIEGCST
jgi:hypothetical protein